MLSIDKFIFVVDIVNIHIEYTKTPSSEWLITQTNYDHTH
jgi:hypothetical protein